jgi:hypothetical protein
MSALAATPLHPKEKAARLSGLFLFLPSILRIPSPAIKPAKYLERFWRGNRLESSIITLDFEAGA